MARGGERGRGRKGSGVFDFVQVDRLPMTLIRPSLIVPLMANRPAKIKSRSGVRPIFDDAKSRRSIRPRPLQHGE